MVNAYTSLNSLERWNLRSGFRVWEEKRWALKYLFWRLLICRIKKEASGPPTVIWMVKMVDITKGLNNMYTKPSSGISFIADWYAGFSCIKSFYASLFSALLIHHVWLVWFQLILADLIVLYGRELAGTNPEQTIKYFIVKSSFGVSVAKPNPLPIYLLQ